MKIYSLGVKFPYVTASRLGKHLKDKGELMLMGNVTFLALAICKMNIFIELSKRKSSINWRTTRFENSVEDSLIHFTIYRQDYNQPFIC